MGQLGLTSSFEFWHSEVRVKKVIAIRLLYNLMHVLLTVCVHEFLVVDGSI